jgi:hypothetical protein
MRLTINVSDKHTIIFLYFLFLLPFLTFILVSSLHSFCPFFVFCVAFSVTMFIAISFFVLILLLSLYCLLQSLVLLSSRYRPFEIITQSLSFYWQLKMTLFMWRCLQCFRRFLHRSTRIWPATWTAMSSLYLLTAFPLLHRKRHSGIMPDHTFRWSDKAEFPLVLHSCTQVFCSWLIGR